MLARTNLMTMKTKIITRNEKQNLIVECYYVVCFDISWYIGVGIIIKNKI